MQQLGGLGQGDEEEGGEDGGKEEEEDGGRGRLHLPARPPRLGPTWGSEGNGKKVQGLN